MFPIAFGIVPPPLPVTEREERLVMRPMSAGIGAEEE